MGIKKIIVTGAIFVAAAFSHPAAADPTNYVGQAYSSVRGWDISAMFDGSRFVGCTGNQRTRADTLILSIEYGQWTMTVPTIRNSGFDGAVVQVDRTQIDAQFGFDGGYATRDIGNYGLGLLKSGSTLHVTINGEDRQSFSLSGSAAAIQKIEECNNLQGQAPRQGSGNTTNTTRPAPKLNPTGPIQASCATVFSGQFPCTITEKTPDTGYIRAHQVDAQNGTGEAYFMQSVSDTHADVWFTMDGNWLFLGLWETFGRADECIRPSASQSPEAYSNLGQDAWELCIN